MIVGVHLRDFHIYTSHIMPFRLVSSQALSFESHFLSYRSLTEKQTVLCTAGAVSRLLVPGFLAVQTADVVVFPSTILVAN